MIKKLLITIGLFLFFCFPVFAVVPYEVDFFPIRVEGFVNVDTSSTISVTPDTNEVGLFSDVVVRILDGNGLPLANHTVTLYVQGSHPEITFQQPTDPSDSDGYIFGKVKSSSQGIYVIKATDTTYSQDVDIQDSASFYTFPLPSPILQAEPYYTKGTSNRVYWSFSGGLSTYQYYVEASKNSSFSSDVVSSGWVSGSSFEFTNLSGNQIYYFRVKARNLGGAQSSWSNVVFSVQDSIPPQIKYVSVDRVNVDDKLSSISVIFDVTDNFEVSQVTFFCLLQNGNKEECGNLENSGSRYTANIPLSDLEKGSFGVYFDNYTFCVQAEDKAGNIVDSCDFKIEIKGYVDTSIPIFNNIINSIIKYVNKSFKAVSVNITDAIDQSHQLLLQGITVVITIFVLLVSMSIISGGLFVIPVLILAWLFKFFKLFGIKKPGMYLGYVYDSITGRRIKYAKVTIYDGSNVKVGSDVTNINGEFFGNLDTGKYRIMVARAHYLFPSQLYKEYHLPTDAKLYTSEYLMVSKRNPMNIAIPIDPINIYANWEKQYTVEKRVVRLMKIVAFFFLTIGLGMSLVTLERFPNLINVILSLIYIPVIGVYLKSVLKLKVFVKR